MMDELPDQPEPAIAVSRAANQLLWGNSVFDRNSKQSNKELNIIGLGMDVYTS